MKRANLKKLGFSRESSASPVARSVVKACETGVCVGTSLFAFAERTTMATIKRAPYVPADKQERPRIVTNRDVFDELPGETDCYAISLYHTVSCKLVREETPVNPWTIDMPGILFHGPLLITKEIDGDYVDCEPDMFESLPEMLSSDLKQRPEYVEQAAIKFGVQIFMSG